MRNKITLSLNQIAQRVVAQNGNSFKESVVLNAIKNADKIVKAV